MQPVGTQNRANATLEVFQVSMHGADVFSGQPGKTPLDE
jgi:hypothetical protein